MKQVITILLLLIITGHVAGINHTLSTEIEFAQDLDDKKDNPGKEGKKEFKEYISNHSSSHLIIINKRSFILSPVVTIASPVIDHHTPPPDLAAAI